MKRQNDLYQGVDKEAKLSFTNELWGNGNYAGSWWIGDEYTRI